MGRGVIELPMEEVVDFIKNIVHREQWDKHLLVGGAINSIYIHVYDIKLAINSMYDKISYYVRHKNFHFYTEN